MKNVDIHVNGNTLTVTVDLSKNFGPSNSGKTQIVATTEGNAKITDNISMGLNVYKK